MAKKPEILTEELRYLDEPTSQQPLSSIKISPSIGKYVTGNKEFVEYIFEVRDRIERYINQKNASRPLNILLAASPGSGKSFLIKQIIGSITEKSRENSISDLDLPVEEVYISAFESSEQLFAIFQRIQSLNLQQKIPIVVFDEIDSLVSGHPIYKNFLSPMWDGTFYIGKDQFIIGKSVFVFAGSSLSLEKESDEIIKGLKKREKYNSYTPATELPRSFA